jgi:hypothetical protein
LDELSVVFDLQDGSHIVGRIRPRNVPVVIRSESIGEVRIPLERIRGIQFTASNQQVVVTLQNGDKLQGAIIQDKFSPTTIFGHVAIAIAQLKKLEVTPSQSAPGKLLIAEDWEQVPFPRNSDWGGSHGSPAEIREDEIVLLGRGVRTRQAYSGRVTVDCEVMLEKRATSDGSFGIQFIPVDEPADMGPQRLVALQMIYRNPGAYSGRDGLVMGGENGTLWGEKSFQVEPERVYRIRLEILPDQVQFQIDDEKYEAAGVKVTYEKFRVYLKGWQPGNRWHVRNIRIQ